MLTKALSLSINKLSHDMLTIKMKASSQIYHNLNDPTIMGDVEPNIKRHKKSWLGNLWLVYIFF